MMAFRSILNNLVLLHVTTTSEAWTLGSTVLSSRQSCQLLVTTTTTTALAAAAPSNSDTKKRDHCWNRRDLWCKVPMSIVVSACTTALLTSSNPAPALALVKGVTPPPPKSKLPNGGGADSIAAEAKKCTNVEECQEAAFLKEQREREEAEKSQVPSLTTAAGTRYRDIQVGSGSERVVRDGDAVTVYYKLLKLGKRSYDGLSGEGTVVFSRGYGYESDESAPRLKSFVTTVGSNNNNNNNIAAFNDAVTGMRVGGIRRFIVLPASGWRKPGRQCDGGPGGTGAGGDLKTDYVVVPTATMVATEACFDTTKLPFPLEYGQQRRMAQRFDQSLIMEVEVVQIAASGGGAGASN